MISLAERLAAQNELAGWLDCEQRGRNHRYVPVPQRVGNAEYWQCRRCPVAKRTTGGMPARIDERGTA